MSEQNLDLQVGVKALLRNKDGKYLLLQRSGKKYPEAPLQWDIVGGRINKGSKLIDNLAREIKEETQLVLRETPELIAAQDIILTDKHVVRLTYVVNIEGKPVLDEDHESFQWVDLEEMKSIRNIDKYFKELLEKGIIL